MGTWGCGVLESDSAQDFIDQISDLPLVARQDFVEGFLSKVAADPSIFYREIVAEDAIAAVAIVAAASADSRDYAWMDDEYFLDAIRGVRPNRRLCDLALMVLHEVAEGGK